ncbi:hypothetical protein BDV93DRAFT_67316 [Ceratobasidium sp. AG-I]|nr:hypothetical protein BDV93DRAFT_67316 [Ceratobasidium sp. AG-I]
MALLQTSTDDGVSSSRMSHLQPEPELETQRPSSPLTHPHHLQSPSPPPRRRLGIVALGSTLFVVVMSAGMATFFLRYILVSQVPCVSDSTAFMVRERVVSMDTGETLTLSALLVLTAISHFLSITTLVVFSLLAYRTAYLGLRGQSSASADEEGVSRLPTPLHYGLLVRILNPSAILGLSSPVAYFIPRPGRNSIPPPRLLRAAFGTAFIIYPLSHAVGLADTWLHAVLTVAIADAVKVADSLSDLGLAFNPRCATMRPIFPARSTRATGGLEVSFVLANSSAATRRIQRVPNLSACLPSWSLTT